MEMGKQSVEYQLFMEQIVYLCLRFLRVEFNLGIENICQLSE